MADKKSSQANEFAKESESGSSSGFLREFVDLLVHNKKWWLAPVIIVLVVVAALVILGGSGAAPFIYTLF